MMGKPIRLIAGYKQTGCSFFFLLLFVFEHSRYNGNGLAQCPSSFLLRANINKNKYLSGYEKKKK